jgi:Insertion element 4 transposase N-terminal/Transposase DDE domain
MGGGWSSTRGRLLAGVGAGVLSWFAPPGLVDEVTAQARAEAAAAAAAAGGQVARQRFRALPARLGVYFVLGLCLYSHLPYGQVLEELAGELRAALAAAGWAGPSSAALTGLRRRLGERPFELLFRRTASALSPGRDPWSRVCGLLAVAWDGTTVKVPASAENTAFFGKPGHKGKNGNGPAAGEAAYPQARLVTLVACGTRALLGAAIGPLGDGERKLAAQLAGLLVPGMLLLADRGFYSWRLWKDAAAAGADLLWRVQGGGLRLPVIRELPDGSWLSQLSDPAAVRRRKVKNGKRRRRGSPLPPETGPLPGAVTVRVIEFLVTVTDSETGQQRTERYRMITTLLDHRAAPAAELAAGYARRWAIETSYREFKAYLRGPGRVLRARTPDLARQEIWAYLITCQAIRAVICRAAAGAGLDPGRLSFTTALHEARRTRSPGRGALAAAEAAILASPVPERPGRICARAVNEPSSPWPSRRNQKKPLAQHVEYTTTITPPGQSTQTTASQPKHPPAHQTQPP